MKISVLQQKVFQKQKYLLSTWFFSGKTQEQTKKANAPRKEICNLGKKLRNVYFGFSPTAAFISDDYPCTKAFQLLQEAVPLPGSEKILCGSYIGKKNGALF